MVNSFEDKALIVIQLASKEFRIHIGKTL